MGDTGFSQRIGSDSSGDAQCSSLLLLDQLVWDMPAGPDDDADRASSSDDHPTEDVPRTDDEPGAVDTMDHGDSDRTVANESAVAESDSADEDEWRFSVEDVSDSSPGDDERRTHSGDDSGGNVAGSLISDDAVESGDVDFENAVFVALGVFVVIALIAGAMFGL